MGEGETPVAGAPAAEAPPPQESRVKKFFKAVWDLICEHWFILGLGFAIGFAAAVPDFGRKGGWIAAQWSIKYGAVIIIFFLSGLSLKTRALLTVMARLHVHLFIQFVCLVLTPAIGYGIARALMESSMQPDLVNGLVVAMTMPTTISTNVVFTKQSGGNEAAALVNAVIGNIIGIFVSPGWLYVYLGKSGQAPYADVIKQLAVTIIAPLIVGQLVQYIFPNVVKKAQEKVNFGKIGNLMIILLVWSTFCDTFYKKIHLQASSWVPMLFLEIGIFLSFSAMSLALATFVPFKHIFNFDKADAVAVLMCGSTKTLALGMPLISVLYGKNANIGIISLPLIIYHASQCLIGSLYIKPLKRWVKGPSQGAWPASCWRGAGLAEEDESGELNGKALGTAASGSANNGTLAAGANAVPPYASSSEQLTRAAAMEEPSTPPVGALAAAGSTSRRGTGGGGGGGSSSGGALTLTVANPQGGGGAVPATATAAAGEVRPPAWRGADEGDLERGEKTALVGSGAEGSAPRGGGAGAGVGLPGSLPPRSTE